MILQRTRRDFLKATGLTADTLIMPQLVHGRSKPSEKPNILVIMSDEHASRVPLILSWPARCKGGQRRTQACSLVDVAQTIAEHPDRTGKRCRAECAKGYGRQKKKRST